MSAPREVVVTGSTHENRAEAKRLIESMDPANVAPHFCFVCPSSRGAFSQPGELPALRTLTATVWPGRCELGHDLLVCDLGESTRNTGVECPVCCPEPEPAPNVPERIPLSTQDRHSLRVLLWQWADSHLDDGDERAWTAAELISRLERGALPAAPPTEERAQVTK